MHSAIVVINMPEKQLAMRPMRMSAD